MASAKSKAKAKSGRGGKRPGAGRPPESRRPLHGVSWVLVRKYARLGADKSVILTAMGVDPAVMGDPEFATAFESEMRRGGALLKLDLLADHKRLRRGGDGSVNAVQGALRQISGWGQPSTQKGNQRPDDDAAIADASAILEKLGR